MRPDVTQNQILHSPTNIGPSSDSTNDSAKESMWSNRSLKATGLSLGGLAATSILNQYSPCSFGQSLLRYTISQVPALLYTLATMKIDPSLMIELNKALESSIIKEVGIPEEQKICAAKCLVWLNNPQEFPIFDPSDLNNAFQTVYSPGKNNFDGALEYLDSKGWQCRERFITNPSLAGESFSFTEVPPLDSLNINDALLCFMIPKKNEEGIPHMCVLLKKSEAEFVVYDPSVALPIKTQNSKSCVEQLFKLAEGQRKEFYLFIQAVPKK